MDSEHTLHLGEGLDAGTRRMLATKHADAFEISPRLWMRELDAMGVRP